MSSYKLIFSGSSSPRLSTLTVTNKWDLSPLGSTPLADADIFAQALSQAESDRPFVAALPGYAKKEILNRIATKLKAEKDFFADLLSKEAGKTVAEAEAEVDRAVDCFLIAETLIDDSMHALPLSNQARTANTLGFYKRFPLGICFFITPFNFPLNLAAHKIAPAIAVGCPFILKPASVTPLSSLRLGELIVESGWPKEAIAVLPAPSSIVEQVIQDSRVRLVSFTGSAAVGWHLKKVAHHARVSLELGGNAAVVLEPDFALESACEKIVSSAFFQAGQSCISVQRVLIHESIYPQARETLTTLTRALSPKPLIQEQEALRLESWVASSLESGANLLVGGKRDRHFYAPTLLENVKTSDPLWCHEAFGPIAVLQSYRTFDEALALINDSPFGLQAGIFTTRIDRALQAYETLEVGGVVIGNASSFRSDQMPYGGEKQSGFGREGIQFAMEEMTTLKALYLSTQHNS